MPISLSQRNKTLPLIRLILCQITKVKFLLNSRPSKSPIPIGLLDLLNNS